jgi:SOS response regulatory protein OraA/RecX
MQVLSVKTSRYPQRVYLKFSNGLFIPFYIDDVVSHSIHSGLEVDKSKLDLFVQLSLSYLLREYSLRQIAISPKTEFGLSLKLRVYIAKIIQKYKIPVDGISQQELIQSCIEKLKSQSLINPDEYIKYFIKKNRGKSQREIIYKLEKEGLHIDNSYFNSQSQETEIEKIKNLLVKKKVDNQKMSDFKYKNKIMAYFYRKGFSLSDIKTAIDEILNNR